MKFVTLGLRNRRGVVDEMRGWKVEASGLHL